VLVEVAGKKAMPNHPVSLPGALVQKLPPAARNGMHYLDVQVGGKWDGIIVVDNAGIYLGVYVCRAIESWPLPFEMSAVEDIRPASLRNRALAAIPFDVFAGAVLAVVLVSPIALGLAVSASALFAILSIAICLVSDYVMYQAPGFIFIRFPVALCGIGQILASAFLLGWQLLRPWITAS
jgi:hypothetical protein